jgi:uncharacterized BrkB/YihY/UPF0761 family membrane protein
MKVTRLSLFPSLILFFLLVSFFAGTFLAFTQAHAASVVTATPQEASATPPVASPVESASTAGILLLGVLLVVIILFGLWWGKQVAVKREK